MKNISAKMILFFLAGLIIGGAIIWFCFCCCCKKSCDHGCQIVKPPLMKSMPATIDTTTANTYFLNYMQNPISVDTLKALAVNLEQYYAMTQILNADTTVTGFRIYYGATDTMRGTAYKMMVVGFGSPDHAGSIYATDSEESGTCPFVCDETSPIVQPPK